MDIIERLREPISWPPNGLLLDEAADEIERLQQELSRSKQYNRLSNLEKENFRLKAELTTLRQERDLHYSRVASLIYSNQLKDILSRDVQKWHSEYVDAQKELTTLREKLDKLEPVAWMV